MKRQISNAILTRAKKMTKYEQRRLADELEGATEEEQEKILDIS